MKRSTRRQFLHLAAGVGALPIAPHVAWAQAYPARPIRLVVGAPPGGATDIFARLAGQWLSERLGQPAVTENRPGAAGNIATEAVVRSQPDGYTLLVVAPPVAINATLYENLSFNFLRDTTPVASIAGVPLVMQVNSSFPSKTVHEFIAYSKTSSTNMASGGNGTAAHVAGELFRMMTGVNMIHVPYRGGAPAVTDLLGGQVQVMFGPMPESIEYIKAGKLRALAVTSATRSEALPHIPTVGEIVPGYEASSWFGIVAPKNTPGGIVERLNREVNAALANAGIRQRLADLGSTPLALSPAEFEKLLSDETEKWAKVVKFSGAKPG
jgi:tripartite-type tricarboxylate transporter receptor subunit TctC